MANPPRRLRCQIGHRIYAIEPSVAGISERHPVVVSEDDGKTWRPLGMRLTFSSWVLHSWHTAWPPERVDALVWKDGGLQLKYRDEWAAYEKPLGKWDAESEWTATYLPRQARWHLRRDRILDYESGRDSPI